jgi:septal ring factor EnvC (AmiA/AmiB activator)
MATQYDWFADVRDGIYFIGRVVEGLRHSVALLCSEIVKMMVKLSSGQDKVITMQETILNELSRLTKNNKHELLEMRELLLKTSAELSDVRNQVAEMQEDMKKMHKEQREQLVFHLLHDDAV